jgi:hypothetical protein
VSTATKETNYNIDQIKKNAAAGTLITDQADLQKYGIDYSQAQRDEIANIFANEARTAYGTAQNEFSKDMAAQQATLQDTIRRSQAQAVATGASKGMQAANELSSMLGLQEEAAAGATELQGSYAEALANAQKQAMDIQTARAQTGAEIAAADIAGEAQKTSVNTDYMANDPYRVLTEIAALRAQGDNSAADALMTNWMMAQGATGGQVSSSLNQSEIQQAGGTKPVSSWTGSSGATGLKKNNVSENFEITVGGSTYKAELGSIVSTTSDVVKKGDAAGVPYNTPFIYDDQVYMRTPRGYHKVGGRGTSGVDHKEGDYGNLHKALKNEAIILR